MRHRIVNGTMAASPASLGTVLGQEPPPASVPVRTARWSSGGASDAGRDVPEETAIAFSYNRTAHAVMMGTPADLRDFATGFSLTEGLVGSLSDIEELGIVAVPDGIELRMWVASGCMDRLHARRRSAAGPTGCGMCGLESLAQAVRPPPPVRSNLRVSAADVLAAVVALEPAQTLNQITRAVHAAAFVRPGQGLTLLREDVGRHNALDKLAGALALSGEDAGAGMVVMTSRVSVELVQKAARIGAPILVAVSAPTALALRVAEQAGITIVGVARRDGFEVFTHQSRIVDALDLTTK